MKKLIDSIKKHEDFNSMPYNDSEGYPTIGYGTKLGISITEADWLLRHRLNAMMMKVNYNLELQGIELSKDVKYVLYEMAYQLGVDGLFRFKKMLMAIKNKDYELASKEAINSKWYRQTPDRAMELANIIKKG